jgi:archaellum component FlaC
MTDIVREIEITAALSSDYQAAFNAAASIARSTSNELSQLTRREADLARMTEIAGESAKASAENDAKAVERLQKEYAKLSERLGLVDTSAEGVAAELKRVGERRKDVEALNESARRSAEMGRLAREIRDYTKASEKVKDPALLAQLERLKKRYKELGGVIPDKAKSLGFFATLKQGLTETPGPMSSFVRSISVVGDAFKTAGGTAALAVGGLAAVGAAAISAGKALWDLGKSTITAGDQIAKTSRQLGIASDAYQELAYAVGLGGASEKDFDTALRQLNRQMEAAADGNGKAQKAFAALGISMSEVKSMNAEEMFVRMSDALSEVDDVAAKTRTTMALFGEGGQKVATAIAGGSEALEAMRTEAKKAGYVLDGTALKKAEEANDNFTRAQLQMQGALRQIGVEVMPTVNSALQDFVALIRGNRDTIKEFAEMAGDAFRVGMKVAVGAIEGVNIAVHSFVEGIKFWQGQVARFCGFIDDSITTVVETVEGIPARVVDTFKSIYSTVSAWFGRIKSFASEWINSVVDSITSAILEKVSWLTDSLRGLPLIGDLIGDSPGAATAGNVQIVVHNAVDARGAAPGAGAEIARAVQAGSGASGEAIAGAFAAYAGLSYSGGSR